ncbi:hypothetical protein LTR53_000727 [Teratosphaeriaceae sp. CCFEE 6253]|nr:hypothetical protein LTR53_000727 [Teratosphaeriaceae sp. CCFEE 6253]
MYRTSDPRFRRRLNEIGQSVENATEQAQSGLYIFNQSYIQPCFGSVTSCFTTVIDAGCPTLNLSQRNRLRRQRGRGRSRGRAELNFDFYDDWDEIDETDGLLGWGGNDDFDRLIAGSGAGYGAVTQQPGRQRGMSYPKGRRKSTAQIEAEDPTVVVPGSQGFFGRLFGGKALRYKPRAADLQEHPSARKPRRQRTEGDALLEEEENSAGAGVGRKHGRTRSGTVGSGTTSDSYSSRGDIFPSDEEDAIPLDDEFAMVLERRNTQTGPETESSSGRTRSLRRGKRPSAGSRTSTRRTMSSRSTRSSTGRKSRSRADSLAGTPLAEQAADLAHEEVEEEDEGAIEVPTLSALKQEEREVAVEEEAEVERKRLEAQRVAAERGLRGSLSSAELASTASSTPTPAPVELVEEPIQLPTPLPTDDEEDAAQQVQQQPSAADADDGKT